MENLFLHLSDIVEPVSAESVSLVPEHVSYPLALKRIHSHLDETHIQAVWQSGCLYGAAISLPQKSSIDALQSSTADSTPSAVLSI